MAVRKRDHLLAVAQRMFCETGFHAVSVDAILEEAGVARMTLYKNYGSKEELIIAALKREDRMFRQWLASAVEGKSNHSADRILGLFHALQDRFVSQGYHGCTFIRASIEYPAPSHPIHRAAREHKEMIRSYLRGLAGEVEGADPMILAEQLYLLFEGAITASQLHGEPWPAEYARQAAEKLLAAPSFEPHPFAKRNKVHRETQVEGSGRLGGRKHYRKH
jgi:AcrR family transcriptional regulator